MITVERDAPAVSFDTSLGERYSFVQFNEDEFDEEADRIGLSQGARAKLAIDVEGPEGSIGRGTAGSYHIPKKRIKVKAGRHTNNSMRHEMKHAADDEAGLIGTRGQRLAGNLSMSLSNATTAAQIGVFAAALMGMSEVAREIATNPATAYISTTLSNATVIAQTGVNATPLIGMSEVAREIVADPITAYAAPLAIHGLGAYFYFLSPQERRARKSARESNANIFTLQKK